MNKIRPNESKIYTREKEQEDKKSKKEVKEIQMGDFCCL